MHKFNTSSKSTIHQFGTKSIFYKYWIRLILWLLIPFLLLNISIYTIISINYKSSNLAALQNNMEKSVMLFNNLAEDLYGKCITISTSDNANVFLCLNDIVNANKYCNIDDLKTYLDPLLYNLEFVNSIKLYSKNSQYVLSGNESNYLKYIDNKDWINSIDENTNMTATFNNKNELIMSYRIKSGKYYGVLGVFLNYNKLTEYINHFSDDTVVFIYDTKNDIIVPSDYNISNNEKSKINNNISEYTSFTDSNDYIQYQPTQFPGISIITISKLPGLPYNKLIIFVMILSVVLSIIIVSFISFLMSKQYYSSISKIISEIYKVADTIPNYNDNELYYITNSIIKLNNNKNYIEKELIDKIAALKQYQTITLQNQINPHFIFNVINSVNAMIMYKCEDERPSEMLSLLCELLSTIFDANDYLVSIEQELKYTKTYINIMKMKYNQPIDIQYNIEHQLLKCTILKFTIQPIVENAFNHGLSQYKHFNNAFIKINIYSDNKDIVICIQNNGESISKENIDKIMNNLNDTSLINSKHIGLKNVHNRIKIFFGDSYGIRKICSDELQTSIYIHIPYSDNK